MAQNAQYVAVKVVKAVQNYNILAPSFHPFHPFHLLRLKNTVRKYTMTQPSANVTTATTNLPIFTSCTFTFSGILAAGKHYELAAIVNKHGGLYSSRMTKAITHVVCSPEDYQTRSPKVTAALKKPEEISIVKWEFVDESIQAGKRLKEEDYAHTDNTLKVDNTQSVNNTGNVNNNQPDAPAKKGSQKRKADDSNEADDTEIKKKLDKVETTPPPPEKRVKLIRKGRAVVDGKCTLQNYHVLDEDGIVWDALLNQADVKENNNKFYIIQVLESDDNRSYQFYTRYGRTGYDGTTSCTSESIDSAKKLFREKFRSKTQNSWDKCLGQLANFTSIKGKYTLIGRDWGTDDEAEQPDQKAASSSSSNKKQKTEDRPSTKSILHPKVQDIVSMLFNVQSFEQAMAELDYDATKLPLGKISKETIKRGYSILRKIEAVILNAESGDLDDLTSEFYTAIPHEFRMKRPPVIRDIQLLQKKIDMVAALGEIEIATTLLNESKSAVGGKHPLDAKYETLRLKHMVPLERDTPDFNLVQQYVQNTHGDTHSSYKLEVMEVFDVRRQGEDDRFTKNIKPTYLLWHGSRRTNFAGILSQGLRIQPPSAPKSGSMFGHGIYGADSVSKSANYCFTSSGDNIGFLLLCEFAVGDMLPLVNADYNAPDKCKREGKTATLGVGKNKPDPQGQLKLEDGTIVPAGKLVNTNGQYGGLVYNEYIVYNENQVRIRYLIKMKFHYKY